METIRAVWTKGQILPQEPVDWPEGSELVVRAVAPAQQKIGLSEDEWRDDPEAIAEWIAAVEKIEPMIWEPGEREEYERYRQEVKKFNIEAVRKQMEDMGKDDG